MIPVGFGILINLSYPSVPATFLAADDREHIVSILLALENHLQAFDPTTNEDVENQWKAKYGSDLQFPPSYEELELRILRLEAER